MIHDNYYQGLKYIITIIMLMQADTCATLSDIIASNSASVLLEIPFEEQKRRTLRAERPLSIEG